MHRHRLATVLLILLALTAAPLAAQDEAPFSLYLLGGVGGSFDGDPDPGLGNPGFELGVGILTEPRTIATLRVGRISADDEDALGNLSGPELEYATVGAEYRMLRGFYDSGLFIGAGGYRLTGERDGVERDETAWGVHLGVSGEFRLTSWAGFLVQVTAHWADLSEAQIYGVGHAGLALHF